MLFQFEIDVNHFAFMSLKGYDVANRNELRVVPLLPLNVQQVVKVLTIVDVANFTFVVAVILKEHSCKEAFSLWLCHKRNVCMEFAERLLPTVLSFAKWRIFSTNVY